MRDQAANVQTANVTDRVARCPALTAKIAFTPGLAIHAIAPARTTAAE
ncbi:MAG: hypothetical protein ACPG43_06090 [Alcanivoracaceae bacterium]